MTAKKAAAKTEAQGAPVDPVDPVVEKAPEVETEKEAEAPQFKSYVTTEKHSIPFSVQVRGEVIQGTWSKAGGLVEFMVPLHLVDGFEGHHHFAMGNVKAVA